MQYVFVVCEGFRKHKILCEVTDFSSAAAHILYLPFPHSQKRNTESEFYTSVNRWVDPFIWFDLYSVDISLGCADADE